MRDTFGKIKCPFLRRAALCGVFIPAVAVYLVEQCVEVMDDAIKTFKDIWKGVE